jgi:maltoporin
VRSGENQDEDGDQVHTNRLDDNRLAKTAENGKPKATWWAAKTLTRKLDIDITEQAHCRKYKR